MRDVEREVIEKLSESLSESLEAIKNKNEQIECLLKECDRLRIVNHEYSNRDYYMQGQIDMSNQRFLELAGLISKVKHTDQKAWDEEGNLISDSTVVDQLYENLANLAERPTIPPESGP